MQLPTASPAASAFVRGLDVSAALRLASLTLSLQSESPSPEHAAKATEFWNTTTKTDAITDILSLFISLPP
jgi:hypothetical protein